MRIAVHVLKTVRIADSSAGHKKNIYAARCCVGYPKIKFISGSRGRMSVFEEGRPDSSSRCANSSLLTYGR